MFRRGAGRAGDPAAPGRHVDPHMQPHRALLAFILLLLAALAAPGGVFAGEAADDPAALAEDAYARMMQGDCEGAIRTWTRAAAGYATAGNARGEANACQGIGAACLRLSDFAKAREYLARALALHEKTGNIAGQAGCITNLAEVSFRQGDFDASLELRTRALALHDQLKDGPARAIDLLGTGQVYSRKGARREAVDAFTEALAIFSQAKDNAGTAAALSNIGVEYLKLGVHDMALDCHTSALELHRALADDFQEAKDLANIGLVYEGISDCTAAVDNFTQAFHIQQRVKDEAGAAQTLVNLGVCNKNLGRYGKAIQQFREALGKFQHVNDQSGTADCYTNLGVLFKNIGAWKKAEGYYAQALRIHEKLGDAANKAADLANLGVLYAGSGDYGLALDHLGKAREILARTEDRRQAAICVYNSAAVLVLMERLGEASKLLDGAAAEFARLGYAPGTANCKLARGRIERRLGHAAAADACFSEALDLSRKAEAPDLVCLCANELAASMAGKGRTDDALELYREAIRQVERIRRNVGTFDLASVFHERRSEVYRSAARTIAARAAEDPAAGPVAYAYAEMGLARGFLDMLVESGVDVREGADPDLLRREKFLLSRMASINSTIALEAGSAPPERIEALKGKLQDTETEYQKLQIDLKQKCPRYAGLYYPETLTAPQVQQALAPDTVLLEYMIDKEGSLLFALTADKIAVHALPPEETLRRQVEEFGRLLTARRSRTYCAAARGLYKALVGPAAELVEGRSRIIVVPDGILHYLPFECLLTEDAPRADFPRLPYLLRTAVVSYAPSASALLELSRRRKADAGYGWELLICADPDYGAGEDEARLTLRESIYLKKHLARLPFSALEAKNVAALFRPDEVVTLCRADASEDKLKAMDLTAFRYVDFAAHALLDEEQPQFSSIVLAQTGGEEDGFLQMQEILNMKLNARLVTLSACSTARGQLLKGEGVVGLSRAFFYAGTPSVVASLWSVNDASTAKLMTELFRALKTPGTTPAQALRQAKLALLDAAPASPFAVVPDKPAPDSFDAAGSYSHPFYWSAFVLMGE